ncbi:MAG: zinc-finger domain-containing protein [Pseudomonadota bacterium]|nr:zinc-finger domain-containing protein [Pseudomonadota bacterium]
MDSVAEIEVRTTTVACDGGGGSLGHPNVYLHMDNDGCVVCPYCSRRYHLKEGVATTKP